MINERSALRKALIITGAIVLGIGAYLLYGALVMVNYMAYYHCMGMMCGAMIYYPLFLSVALLIIGIIAVIAAITLINIGNPNNSRGLGYAMPRGTIMEGTVTDSSSDYYGSVLKLLPKAEREVLEYVIKSGGEVFQYQIMRDLGLSKVQTWRIVHRLGEKGLVKVIKVKGRNIVKLKDLNKVN